MTERKPKFRFPRSLLPLLVMIAAVGILAYFTLTLPIENVPPPDEISETITVTATVDTQVHFTRTVSEGIGISGEQ